ncbi:MAG: dienelactone hydrolase family protein [Planctomycetota bacterium]|nr:dienelactone hydrolase family protein [Planctomycetota bacterium]
MSGVLGVPARTSNGTGVLLAHGAGTDMREELLSAIHRGLAERGYLTLKFNFPYSEMGRKSPDAQPRLEECYRRAYSFFLDHPKYSPQRLFVGGKSMGGRIASHLVATGLPAAGLIFLGYPLHPAGKPEKLRIAHLRNIPRPMLFLSGAKDRLCTIPLLKEALERVPAPTRLHVLPDGDHSFHVPKAFGRSDEEIQEELTEVITNWIEEQPR